MTHLFHIKPVRGRLPAWSVLIPALLLNGCSSMSYYNSISYYYQAAKGQAEIWHKSRPIERVLRDTPEDTELSRRLRLVQDIRAYARTNLQLPVGDTFRDYADLDRSYVVWNLFAAPELSLEPRQWCYPLLGCLSYRGYFSPQPALAESEVLQQEGWETYVGGIIAYSTLGWFNDPVLNTFWLMDDAELAALLFHELAHQVAFTANDTTFNESFATAVELYGVELWLHERYGPEQARRQRIQFDRRQQFVAEVRDITEQLRGLYRSDATDEDKRAGKQRLFDELKRRYASLREQWGEDPGYDAWFRTPLNNAKLITLTSYYDLVPVFLEKIRQLDGDLPAFYRWAKDLAKKPRSEREPILKGLHEDTRKGGQI